MVPIKPSAAPNNTSPASARESIENLWDRATPVAPLLDAYRAEVLREAVKELTNLPLWYTADLHADWETGVQEAASRVQGMADANSVETTPCTCIQAPEVDAGRALHAGYCATKQGGAS